LSEQVSQKTEKPFYVYILRCEDNSLYTGIATNTFARLKTHNDGKGAKYTRGRRPVRLIYQERHASMSLALKREAAIKKLSRAHKESLLANQAR
jgi:putative endonuclease